MSLFTFNCQSLRAHVQDLQHDNIVSSSNFLILSETWMNNEDIVDIPNFNIVVNYKRPRTRAGGVAIYHNVNDGARVVTPQMDLNAQQLESLSVQLSKVGEICAWETSQTPLSPLSMGDSCGEDPLDEERPRLQRSHGPSKKTFKFRRSRNSKPDLAPIRLESDSCSSPGAESTPLRRAWPGLLPPTATHTDTSYDSEISQTSSTSGYRESYSLQASMSESPGARSVAATPRASPDASLSCDSVTSSAERTALLGAASQHTLLSGDLRDEDTLL
ncbi:unnamed protein product [Pieris brassicae]|uniref:Uncharacterized protein n=1 Tax=Pieris brassicae TaxID=7116 RepID=A0A9P0X374_PIEBR|nr:unnamed protein product [Pieris brassicae]